MSTYLRASCLAGSSSWYVFDGPVMQLALLVAICHDNDAGRLGQYHRSDASLWSLQTFVLVFIVYSCCISKPGFGNIAPLMVGYTLFASAFVVSWYSVSVLIAGGGAEAMPAPVL